jgi:hypothetical protein
LCVTDIKIFVEGPIYILEKACIVGNKDRWYKCGCPKEIDEDAEDTIENYEINVKSKKQLDWLKVLYGK